MTEKDLTKELNCTNLLPESTNEYSFHLQDGSHEIPPVYSKVFL